MITSNQTSYIWQMSNWDKYDLIIFRKGDFSVYFTSVLSNANIVLLKISIYFLQEFLLCIFSLLRQSKYP